MISALNLRLQLSGNKLIFPLCLIVLSFACSPAKKTVHHTEKPKAKSDSPIVNHKQIPSKIDTILWKNTPSKDIVIGSDKSDGNETGKEKKNEDNANQFPKSDKDESSYNILAFIPFKTNEMDSSLNRIPSNNLRFVQFYAGFKMALDELNLESGKKVRLDVYDTQSNEATQSILAKYNHKNLHLIIGPYKPEALKLAAEWSKLHHTGLISPWVSSSSITDKNPYYIQAKAGLNAHYKAINEDARNHFPVKNIILVSKTAEESKEKYFNDTSSYTDKIQEKIIKEDDLTNSQNAVLSPLFVESGTTVFLLPIALSKDENYIYQFLRRLTIEKGNKDVVVYGMYKWLDLRNEIYDYLNNLKVRLSISNYADADDSNVKNFKKKYLLNYHEFPTEDAMDGYDLAKFSIHAIRNNGSLFYMRPGYTSDGLQTHFKLQAVFKSKIKSYDPMSADYFENAYIKMVEVRNGKLKEVGN